MSSHFHHKPRKRFGQHFLTNTGVITDLVRAINPQVGDKLVEIGPGLGALTSYLLPLVKTMEVIELDRDLIAPLQDACENLGSLLIHQASVLDFDFTRLTDIPHSLRVVGNLPYQISTPIIFHLIAQIAVIKDMHFMLQKEVVERLAANPGSKTYGRLSIMVQYQLDVEELFTVAAEAFDPPPRVTSAVVRLWPKSSYQRAEDYGLFSAIVKQAFNHRRKTLSNSLKEFITAEKLADLGIDPHRRPEELAVAEFVKISNALFQVGNGSKV